MNPMIQYTKVKVQVRLKIVQEDALMTMILSENATEFSKYIVNETMIMNVSTKNYEPVNYTI
jgi:hypothetical protein